MNREDAMDVKVEALFVSREADQKNQAARTRLLSEHVNGGLALK